ncbi:MAG: hypothetical protein L0Z50_16360, partial [Verrucomicrobiales bacterium]|nr:hypothetical protein [Verrucomicrobiales bacterium]
GSAAGVTWNCPADTEIANHRTDCPFGGWEGGLFGLPTASGVTLFEDQWGEVKWDVTMDVRNGVTAWLLKKDPEDASGEVWFFSKEGAAAAEVGNPDLAPRLILEIAIEDEFVK